MSSGRRWRLFQPLWVGLRSFALITVLYFLSFAPVVWCVNKIRPSQRVSEAIYRTYYPLAKLAPRKLLESYSTWAGLSKSEAFFFVEALASPPVSTPFEYPDFYYTAPLDAE